MKPSTIAPSITMMPAISEPMISRTTRARMMSSGVTWRWNSRLPFDSNALTARNMQCRHMVSGT